MLKKIFAMILLCGCTLAAQAQQTLNAKQMVAITPMVSGYIDLPSDAIQSLKVKLGQMVTQNGFGSNSSQFILTANVVMLDKQATATAPVQFMTKIEVSVYLLDVSEGVAIDEMSFVVVGVDRLENKAMIQAINQIKPRSTEAQAFMERCRVKIIDYYTTRVPQLLAKADALAKQDQYGEALEILAGVPDCIDQYQQVADKMSAIYVKMVDHEAAAAIAEAKGLIAVGNYEEALEALKWVSPSSTLAPQALAQVNAIRSSINASQQAALSAQAQRYEEEMRVHDDKVMLAKMQIEAATKIGVEAARNNGSVANRINNWFMGKFGK